MKNKKMMYVSILVLLNLTSILVGISFAYYVDETGDTTEIKVTSIVNNTVLCDDLNDGILDLNSNESREIELLVMSNSSSTTNYKLYYVGDDAIDISSTYDLEGTIEASKTIIYRVTVTNTSSEPNSVYIGILSSSLEEDIKLASNFKPITNE